MRIHEHLLVPCLIVDIEQLHQIMSCLWNCDYLPPFSMPFTAAPEIVLSTALAASLMVSTGLLRAMGVVENRRAWRAIWERNMMMCGVVVDLWM